MMLDNIGLPTMTSATFFVSVLTLLATWISRHPRRVPPAFIRRTYTAPSTYIAEAVVKPNQATSLVFPAPTAEHRGANMVPTILRDFAEDFAEGCECAISFFVSVAY